MSICRAGDVAECLVFMPKMLNSVPSAGNKPGTVNSRSSAVAVLRRYWQEDPFRVMVSLTASSRAGCAAT